MKNFMHEAFPCRAIACRGRRAPYLNKNRLAGFKTHQVLLHEVKKAIYFTKPFLNIGIAVCLHQ
jgi:hypothetical protein